MTSFGALCTAMDSEVGVATRPTVCGIGANAEAVANIVTNSAIRVFIMVVILLYIYIYIYIVLRV